MKMYHWTKKSKRKYIEKVGIKIRRCLESSIGRGIYVSNIPEKWKSVIAYDYDSDAICFSFDSDKLKIEKVRDDIFIVLENIAPERLSFEGDYNYQKSQG